MKPGVELRAMLTDSQAERLQQRLTALPFKVNYQEEQHGPSLVICVQCTPSQENTLREILRDLGASISPAEGQ